MSKFNKMLIAYLKGDDATIKAVKIERQAESALKSHIAQLEGDLAAKEDAIKDAQEELENACINNGELIASENRHRYIQGIIDAKNRVIEREDELAEINAKLEVLREAQGLLTAKD